MAKKRLRDIVGAPSAERKRQGEFYTSPRTEAKEHLTVMGKGWRRTGVARTLSGYQGPSKVVPKTVMKKLAPMSGYGLPKGVKPVSVSAARAAMPKAPTPIRRKK